MVTRVIRMGRAATLASGVAGALSAIVSGQAPQAPTQRAMPIIANGQAQIVPAFQEQADWIRHALWVETEVDSDHDGRRDRVFVDVTRQKQTDAEGLKVPVIYESSPYFSGTANDREAFWNVNQELGAVPQPRKPNRPIAFQPNRARVSNSQVNTWLPRGFAVVHSDAPGTGRSQGCPTVGGAPEELAPKAVIDWLNGRARGYTTIDGREEVVASWATGKVGMIGTSYNGTIPLAAATTGVKGLEAIIPIAPNTSYYHYYRSNGLVRSPGGYLGEDIDVLYDVINSGETERRVVCNALYRDGVFAEHRDRLTGDYNAFWAERDLLPKVKNVKAAVLMAHAFNDWNVVPEHSVRIYEALKGRVPLQAYYHQGGHGGSPPLDMMNRWFTRYLYGVENGVEKGPKAWIVREPPPPAPGAPPPAPPTGRGAAPPPPPTPYADYPNRAAAPVTLRLLRGGGEQGTLTLSASARQGAETLVDNVEIAAPALATAPASRHRLLYATPELAEPLHISGFVRVVIRLAASKPAANLSVYLVQLPWTGTAINTTNLITRGWADPQNAGSLKRGGDYHSLDRGKPLEPGKFVDLAFDLQPDDQIIPAGKRIGLMILSSDRDFTLWPKPGTELTVDLDATSIRIPIVGGAAAYRRATRSR
jgi:X-Pro dipeptidyl-peptidase